MGKNILVKCVSEHPAGHMRDMTFGGIYCAYVPSEGEEDKDGLPRQYDDEVWIYRDDAGDEVVARMSNGFELVGE